MARDTTDLIRRLAAAGEPVRPLARPWARTAVWCAISLPYLALVYLVLGQANAVPIDRRFVIEQAAALATGLTAAAAAFATIVPGASRKLAIAPLVPLALWVGNLGRLCARDWSASGHRPVILIHWGCFPITVVAGIVPAIVIVMMLRRGAPMTPRLTTALGALAVAGLANFGILFVHPFDASVVVLAWHVVAVFLFSGAVTCFGDRLFDWRKVIAASGAGV